MQWPIYCNQRAAVPHYVLLQPLSNLTNFLFRLCPCDSLLKRPSIWFATQHSPPRSSINGAASYFTLWSPVRDDSLRLPCRRDSLYITCRQHDLTTLSRLQRRSAHTNVLYRARAITCKSADWKGVSQSEKVFCKILYMKLSCYGRQKPCTESNCISLLFLESKTISKVFRTFSPGLI